MIGSELEVFDAIVPGRFIADTAFHIGEIERLRKTGEGSGLFEHYPDWGRNWLRIGSIRDRSAHLYDPFALIEAIRDHRPAGVEPEAQAAIADIAATEPE